MKKLIALLLALSMAFAMVACGSNNSGNTTGNDANTTGGNTTNDTGDTSGDAETESDLAYVQDKGTLVVGITYFDPMDYKEEGSDE